MARLARLSRVQIGEYSYASPQGERLRICKGWALRDAARKGALMGRWYVTNEAHTRRLGNPDGYDSLRSLREHIAAVEHDQALPDGAGVRWGI